MNINLNSSSQKCLLCIIYNLLEVCSVRQIYKINCAHSEEEYHNHVSSGIDFWATIVNDAFNIEPPKFTKHYWDR